MEYAPSAEFLNEDRSPLGPLSPYAQAKIETCKELQLVAEAVGIIWTWIRPFYPYGEDEHPGRMPSTIARALISQQAAEIKSPESIKDYIHVDDIASALLSVVENRLVGAVNVATGEGIQIEEMARMIAIECGFHPDCITRPPVIVKDPFPVTVADITKLRESGWRQRISLQEGIAKLCASLR
jgi:dTDP-6-deoxy-L-talose 4-dehydrogenase (NAD+)